MFQNPFSNQNFTTWLAQVERGNMEAVEIEKDRDIVSIKINRKTDGNWMSKTVCASVPKGLNDDGLHHLVVSYVEREHPGWLIASYAPLMPDDSGLDARFVRLFDLMAFEVHSIAIDKGWWNEPRNDGEIIALMHSELSEALEAMRHGNPPSDKISEFSGVEEELADLIIRIMDMAPARGLRVAEAIVAKMEYNRNRPHKHGKRF